MPNIVTHYLFANECAKKLNKAVQKCIEKYPREYIIGSNGPDFLFFYQFFDSKKKHIRDIGNLLHAYKINEFYTKAGNIINQCDDEELKEAMTSYLAGHLCHWALDSTTHPYVFYKTGWQAKINESMHHRFEYMIDALLLEKMKQTSIKKFKYYLLTKQSKISVKTIASIYVPICNELFDSELDEKIIKQALDDWYSINRFCYDPYKVKTPFVKLYEKKVNSPYLYSGNIIPAKADYTYDVLNLEKNSWCYPVDDTKTSNESFIELFEKAQNLAVDCIEVMLESDKLCDHLQDHSYDTGSTSHDMKYYDLIYDDVKYEEEENENI